MIARSLVTTLLLLKQNGVIHADIKPENILFVDSHQESIKLIDFGSALFIEENSQHFVMQTLPYRAPEIALLADYDYQIDIWSLGCVLYELATSNVLFNLAS